jgi:hypothetical protein
VRFCGVKCEDKPLEAFACVALLHQAVRFSIGSFEPLHLRKRERERERLLS